MRSSSASVHGDGGTGTAYHTLPVVCAALDGRPTRGGRLEQAMPSRQDVWRRRRAKRHVRLRCRHECFARGATSARTAHATHGDGTYAPLPLVARSSSEGRMRERFLSTSLLSELLR